MNYIDLRSDTVTTPTDEMREAMARAEVGDDVYGEDPSARRLQERAAEIFGKDAALFVPSGTMGNQIAVRLHTQPGQEVIIEERSHMFNLELAGMAVISGAQAHPVAMPGWNYGLGLNLSRDPSSKLILRADRACGRREHA